MTFSITEIKQLSQGGLILAEHSISSLFQRSTWAQETAQILCVLASLRQVNPDTTDRAVPVTRPAYIGEP